MRAVRTFAAACAASALLLVAACSPTERGGDLETVLRGIPDTPENAAWVSYANVEAAGELGALDTVDHPMFQVVTSGYGAPYVTLSSQAQELLPVPGEPGASAVAVGMPPDTAFQYTGLESGAVQAYLTDAQGERSEVEDGTLLQRRGDHEVDLQDETFPPNMVNTANTVWFDNTTFIGSSTRAGALGLAEGASASLADSGLYDGVVDCLDEVVVAFLGSGDQAPGSAQSAGIGVRADTEDEFTEVLCVRSDEPDELAERLEQEFTDGVNQYGQPWSTLFDDVQVDSSGGWARAVVTPAGPAGVLHSALRSGDLAQMVG